VSLAPGGMHAWHLKLNFSCIRLHCLFLCFHATGLLVSGVQFFDLSVHALLFVIDTLETIGDGFTCGQPCSF
jgi:hypothetical protein